MTMFNLAKAISDILSPEFTVVSVFPAGPSDGHEMTLSIELEDEISVTARIGTDIQGDPAALTYLQRRYKREIASIAYLEKTLPDLPVPYVIQVDASCDNAVHGPYLVVEDPLGEQLHMAVRDMDMEQKERLTSALGESLARIFRLPGLPSKIGSISGQDDRTGAPIVGPLAREWGHASGRQEGPFDNIKAYLANELLQASRAAQDDPTSSKPGADGSFRTLLARLNALLPHIVPSSDATMLRPALAYSDLKDQSIFVLEDGALGGIAGKEGTILPACLAASYPVFLRRDGIHSKTYRDPRLPKERYLLPDAEVAHLRDVFVEAANRIEPGFGAALIKGDRLRQMLELMTARNWDGLRKWEADTRRELGLTTSSR